MSDKEYVDCTHDVCQTKWSNLFGDFKAIRDYLVSSKKANYHSMSQVEREEAKLVPTLNKDYDFLELYCQQRPCMVPSTSYNSGLPMPHFDGVNTNLPNTPHTNTNLHDVLPTNVKGRAPTPSVASQDCSLAPNSFGA